MFWDRSFRVILNVGGIVVPLYLTVKNDDYDKAGIATYKVENVKNFKYGWRIVELSIFKTNVMLLTDDLLSKIGIFIS